MQKALNIFKTHIKGGLFMGSIIVGNFGIQEGVQTYRINGSYEDLQRILDECLNANAKFAEFPEIERLKRTQCTMLLKLYVYNSGENS